jgi:predicted Zn finger-like uncharacterized protein
MIITCGNCETSFNLDEKLLKPTGSKVRCSRCKHMFTAYPPALPELEQEVAATPAPEEIEEKVEAAETPESEPISEETDNMAAEAMEPEPSQEDAGDIFAEAIEEADAEEGAGDEVESAVQEELDASLDDLDLAFDIDTASEEIEKPFDMEPSAEETPTEDVSLEDLDLDFDEAPEEEMSVEGDAIEDLDLDFDEAPEEETSAEGDTIEKLDLDFDEVLEEKTPVEEDAIEDLDLDLDLDLGLDVTSEEEISAEEGTTSEKLDLSDLELSMESELEAETDEDELDLDLDLDSEPEADLGLTEDQGDTDSEELDFSDFEETVMMDSPPKIETGDVSGELGEELELDLDLEMADDALPDVESALPSMKKEDVELEDLDFELDMELEGEAVEDIDAEDSEDVDLSDIEKMLEGDGTEHETVSLVSDLDNIETEVEKWKESPDTDDLMDQTGEIDLSDIMIDADDDDLEEDIEDVELELDIGEASEPVIAAGGGREPENIDISGFDEFDIPTEGDQVQGHFSGGDIELEFEVDGDADDLDTMATISDAEEIGVGSGTIANAEPLVDADDAPTKKKEKKKKPKKIKSVRKSGILRPVMLLLLLILLPLAVVVLLDRFMDMNVPFVTDYLKQVPYLNQVMKPEMKETGEISVDDISSKFIDNTTHGKLFIITGTTKNEFSESRKYIKIQGSLFSAGKTLAKEVTVYGGNVLTDLDLSEMSLTDINQRLSNRFGDKKSNFDVKPGKSIPFMVVFSDLPESLEEFTIEVSGSFPATKQQ